MGNTVSQLRGDQLAYCGVNVMGVQSPSPKAPLITLATTYQHAKGLSGPLTGPPADTIG